MKKRKQLQKKLRVRKAERFASGLRPVLDRLANEVSIGSVGIYGNVCNALSLWSTKSSSIIGDLSALDVSELFYHVEQLDYLLKRFCAEIKDISYAEIKLVMLCDALNSGRFKNSTKSDKPTFKKPGLQSFFMFSINFSAKNLHSKIVKALVHKQYLYKETAIKDGKTCFVYTVTPKGRTLINQFYLYYKKYLNITQY